MRVKFAPTLRELRSGAKGGIPELCPPIRWDDRRRDIEKRVADPDDVFFAARDRKQEIKEQIKQLQAGLARQNTKRRSEGKKRRRQS